MSEKFGEEFTTRVTFSTCHVNDGKDNNLVGLIGTFIYYNLHR